MNQVDAPGRSPGRRWVAELVDASGHLTVPRCVAWLTDCTPTMPVILDFLIVPFEDDRRLGYGSRMVDELRRVWPDLIYTDPVTPAGEKFYETLPEPDWEGTIARSRANPGGGSEVTPAVRKAMEAFQSGRALLNQVEDLKAENARLRALLPKDGTP